MTKAKKATKKTGAWQQHTPRDAEMEGEEAPASAAQRQGTRQLRHHKPVDYVRSVLGYTKDNDADEDYVDSIEDVAHDEVEDADDPDSEKGKVESDQDAEEPGDAPNDASEVDAGNRAMVAPDADDGKTESETIIYQRYIQAVWTAARAIPEETIVPETSQD
ncbi:hypothetical protein PHMEG_00029923 [Phytophthora megakarya]|uniref:Uncharacterized protein n=1 Tax=Phytophthora megakarya TaxID=4795 RepID=A0A225V1H5_9STRA|nr:hypothetical protein PHMEG_00029923 [Phytophthora megakarya]